MDILKFSKSQFDIMDEHLKKIADSQKTITGEVFGAVNLARQSASNAENKINEIEDRFATLTAEQQQDAEVIDARDGKESLKARLDRDLQKVDENRMDVFYNRPVSAKKKKRLLAWIDDDGHIDFYDYFKGLHDEYGVVFNAAIVGSWIGNSARLSKEQIQELQSCGFGFPSHGYTHDTNKKLWDMTEEELHEEFRLALASLKEIGSDSRVLVYGFGAQNERVREVARQYFVAGIDTRRVKSGDNPGGYNAGLVSNFALQRLNIHMGNDICFPILEDAAANNEPIILMSHINQSGWPSDAEIRALIEKCLSLGYEFVTIDDYIRRTGNALEMGDMIVNADGVTRTLGRYRYAGKHVNQMPADYFPDDVVTRFFVSDADISKFGLTGPGEIKTYKFADDNYTYQEYTSALEGKVLYRKWDTQGDKWGPWDGWGSDISLYDNTTTLPFNVVRKKWNELPHTAFPRSYTIRAAQGYIGLGVVLKLSSGTGAAIVIQRNSITYNEYDGTNWTTHNIVGE